MKKVVIIGAGITGATVANRVYGKMDVQMLEQQAHIGGKCYSYAKDTKVGDFRFDIGGHWLHRELYRDIGTMFSGLIEYQRNAYVHLNNSHYAYPIQAHYNQIPDYKIVRDIGEELKQCDSNRLDHYHHYEELLIKSYGNSLYSLFFKDYNEKLFNPYKLDAIQYGNFETKRNISVKDRKGYNKDFLYFHNGKGIKQLIEQLVERIDIQLNHEVISIDVKNKNVICCNGRLIEYDYLINTMPLNKLIHRCKPIDEAFKKVGRQLQYTTSVIYNIGIRNNGKHQHKTWVYYSDKELPFYRIGVYSNIDKKMAPDGYSAIYVEAKEEIPKDLLIDKLRKLEWIDDEEDIAIIDMLTLDENYCLHHKKVPGLLDEFKNKSIYSIGRYGGWRWSSMHEDMNEAIQVANDIMNEHEQFYDRGRESIG